MYCPKRCNNKSLGFAWIWIKHSIFCSFVGVSIRHILWGDINKLGVLRGNKPVQVWYALLAKGYNRQKGPIPISFCHGRSEHVSFINVLYKIYNNKKEKSRVDFFIECIYLYVMAFTNKGIPQWEPFLCNLWSVTCATIVHS